MSTVMYTLTLRGPTPKGSYMVDRTEWIEFPKPGDWCRDALSCRCVSGRLRSRNAAAGFAAKYVQENPGHTNRPEAATGTRNERVARNAA